MDSSIEHRLKSRTYLILGADPLLSDKNIEVKQGKTGGEGGWRLLLHFIRKIIEN
jgi:hypothetical protein